MNNTAARILPLRFSSQLREFEGALHEDTATAIREQRKVVLPGDNVYGYTHGRRWRTTTIETNNNSEEGVMQEHSTEIEIPFQSIVDNDLGILERYQAQLVSGIIQELMRTIYQAISESTEKTGNTVGGGEGGFKADHFLEMLEKIEFGVDRNGKVSFPEIHAGPELVKKIMHELTSQGAKFEARVQELISKKSKAALEREDERKARFPKFSDETE